MINKKEFKDEIGQTKHYTPATQEWFNSVYNFNKNENKSIPVVDNVVNNILKSYFNLRPLYAKYKVKRFRYKRRSFTSRRFSSRRFSSKKIFISRAKIKHTNNKVIINTNTFDKLKIYYISKFLKLNTDVLLILKKKNSLFLKKNSSQKKNSSFFSLYKKLKLKFNLTSLKYLKGILNKKQQEKIKYIAINGLNLINNNV